MINITISNNSDSWMVMASPDTTIRQVFERENVNTAGNKVQLNMQSLSDSDLDKTFNDFGIQTNAFLTSVRKLNNAR